MSMEEWLVTEPFMPIWAGKGFTSACLQLINI